MDQILTNILYLVQMSRIPHFSENKEIQEISKNILRSQYKK